MWKATSGSLALRSELSPCALQIPFRNGHPALGYTTRLAFSRGRTSTCKSMILHGTHKKGICQIDKCPLPHAELMYYFSISILFAALKLGDSNL